LTDSGLGCPDWPGCYGNTSPWGAQASINVAQAAMPTGPVTHGKAWIEMIHRYLATGVGALILAMTAMSWWARWRQSPVPPQGSHQAMSPWWPTLTLFWVCLQGAFGAWTVTWKLFPAIVSMHLAGAVVLLTLLGVQAVWGNLATVRPLLPKALRKATWLVLLLLGVQVMLGAWVSTNYAVLACDGFPTCQGSWWPDMNFAQGFEIWRHLGLRASGEPIDFAALTAIHYAHRLMAYGVLSALAWLAWQFNRHNAWRPAGRLLALLLGMQLATGLSNVLFDWPLLSALMHTGGSAALVLHLASVLARTVPEAPGVLDARSQPFVSGRRSLT